MPRSLLCVLLVLLAGCASTTPPPAEPKVTSTVIDSFPLRIVAPDPNDLPKPPGNLVLTPQGHAALEVLLRTVIFTDAAVGYAGETPEPVLALRRLWAEPDATRAFAFALEHAPLPGQLFALSGLYHSDRDAFLDALPRFQGIRGSIPTQRGCIRAPAKVPGLVKAIERGDYDKRFRRY